MKNISKNKKVQRENKLKRVEKFCLIMRVAFSHSSIAECLSRKNGFSLPATRGYLVVLCLHDMELRLLVKTRCSFGKGSIFIGKSTKFAAAEKTRRVRLRETLQVSVVPDVTDIIV